MLRIKYLREMHKLTQKELGDRVGQTSSNISKYELGLLEPNLTTLTAIAKAFNVSIDFLVGITDEEYPSSPVEGSNAAYVYLLGDNGCGHKVAVPPEKLPRFKALLKSVLPELFEK